MKFLINIKHHKLIICALIGLLNCVVSVAEPVKVAVPKESDLSSNLSELKLEIEYSGEEESDCDSYGGRPGLPLAGPVPLDHRYSQIYEDTNLPPAKVSAF